MGTDCRHHFHWIFSFFVVVDSCVYVQMWFFFPLTFSSESPKFGHDAFASGRQNKPNSPPQLLCRVHDRPGVLGFFIFAMMSELRYRMKDHFSLYWTHPLTWFLFDFFWVTFFKCLVFLKKGTIHVLLTLFVLLQHFNLIFLLIQFSVYSLTLLCCKNFQEVLKMWPKCVNVGRKKKGTGICIGFLLAALVRVVLWLEFISTQGYANGPFYCIWLCAN